MACGFIKTQSTSSVFPPINFFNYLFSASAKFVDWVKLSYKYSRCMVGIMACHNTANWYLDFVIAFNNTANWC